MRRQRIPLPVVMELLDEVFQSIGSTIKAAKGKELTPELGNELFDKFRDLPAQLKW
jgi:hypothetical protein